LSQHPRFEALVMPHLDAAYNLARWLARDAHDAEDVVQEACIRAMRYADSIRGEGRSWFLTLVRNAFYDWLASNRPAEVVYDEAAIERAVDDSGSEPQQAAMRRDDSRTLDEALAALPLQFREVLVLRELEELSYKEIAHVCDIPMGTVMSRLARARALLQRSPAVQAIAEVPVRRSV